MTITQKESVFQSYQEGVSQGLSGQDLKSFVVEKIKDGLMSGEVEYKNDRTDEKSVINYSRALYSNWMKKDPRLNGGTKYVPQTTRGPRTTDESLKSLESSLKSLKVHNADPDLISRVENAIETRRNELQLQKSQSKVQSLEETMSTLESLGIAV